MKNRRTVLTDIKKNQKKWVKRILFYAVGLFILAMGVSISVRSELGVSPVSSIPFVFSKAFGIELGNMTVLIFCLYVFIQILILRKAFPWFQLLQIACAVLFGKFVTLTGALVVGWIPVTYFERLCMIFSSVFLIALGIKLYLLANIVPQAAEGLIKTIAETGDWKLANVKNIFDLCSITIAAAVSFAATGNIAGLREGTVIAAVGVGRILALLNILDGERLHAYIFETLPVKKPI